eukprot:7370768-Alexandrium_andersonii.AAC.1
MGPPLTTPKHQPTQERPPGPGAPTSVQKPSATHQGARELPVHSNGIHRGAPPGETAKQPSTRTPESTRTPPPQDKPAALGSGAGVRWGGNQPRSKIPGRDSS